MTVINYSFLLKYKKADYINVLNNMLNKKIYKTHSIEVFKSEGGGYLSSLNLHTNLKQGHYEKVKAIFSAKHYGRYDTDIVSFYINLGRIRSELCNLNSMSESDFNDHINLDSKFNFSAIIEDVNFLSGVAFQMEKEYWNSWTFLNLENELKDSFNGWYLKRLTYAQKHGPSNYDVYEGLADFDYSMLSIQGGRSSWEYFLSELRYIEEKHRLLNQEFVKRIKATADWLENELKKTDPILHKMFFKKDKKILTPMYNLYNNQNFWWENTEMIQKLMEENG